jgi:hypothetical protein
MTIKGILTHNDLLVAVPTSYGSASRTDES